MGRIIENTERSPQNTVFVKRSGTTDLGKEYEHIYIANLILKLVVDENIDNFHISSNDKNYGSFDDVVAEIKYCHKKEPEVYACQLKQKQNSKRILTVSALTASSGNFSVKSYYDDYRKVEALRDDHVKMVLFTNSNDKIDTRSPLVLNLDGEEVNTNIFKTRPDDIIQSSHRGSCYKFSSSGGYSFFDNFYLYTSQANFDNLKRDTIHRLDRLFKCGKLVFKKYMNFITEWSLMEGKKEKLDKIWIKRVIALAALSPFIRPLSFSTTSINTRTEMFQEAVSKFDITVIRSENYDRVKWAWKDAATTIDNFEFVNSQKRKYHIKLDYIKSTENFSGNKEASKLLWLLGKCPLVVNACQEVYRAIRIYGGGGFVLLEQSTNDGLDHDGLSVFRKVSDLEKEKSLYDGILLQFSYSLEGQKDVPLKHLIDIDEELRGILTPDDLVRMLDGPLSIGDEKKLPPCYITRRLSRTVIDARVLNHSKNAAIVVQNIEGNIQYSEEEFDNFCRENPTKSCHWLKYINGNHLEWIKSSNSLDAIKKFRLEDDHNDYTVNESQLLDSSDITIICANPGMGKSALMKNLKKSIPSNILAVFVHAGNHAIHFDKHGDDIDKFIEYLIECTSEVLRMFIKKEKIYVIWDGVDEASDETVESILSIVDGISGKGIKQWITCRNHLRDKLEARFTTFGMGLKEFDEDEQLRYIQERLELPDSSEIFAKIQANIQTFSNNDILGIPLQIFMLTELFHRDKAKYLDLLDRVFSIADLYGHFVEEKFKIYYEEKIRHDVNNEASYHKYKKDKESRTRFYKKAAFILHFQRRFVRTALFCFSISDNKYRKFLHHIRRSHDDVGLIVQVNKRSIPRFAHNSYGEYFAALYLYENFEKYELKLITSPKYTNIRFFLDLLLSKNSKGHVAVLYKNCSLLEECSESELCQKDEAGRSILQVSCIRNRNYPLLETEVDFFKKLPKNVHYDTVSKIFDKIDNLCHKQLTLLLPVLLPFYNPEKQHFEDPYILTVVCCAIIFDYYIIFKSVDIFSLAKSKQKSICKLAVEYKSLNCLKFLILEEDLHDVLLEEVSRSNDPKFCANFFSLDPDHFDINKQLRICCKIGNAETVSFLLRNGAKIDAPDPGGKLPIHYACLNESPASFEVVELLIKSGANLHVSGAVGILPIHYACRIKSPSALIVVDLLVANGANVNARDDDGKTPLCYACETDPTYSVNTVKTLLARGAKVDIADAVGKLPLHYACINNFWTSFKIVQILVESGASVDVVDLNGKLPLHYACANDSERSFEMVQLLLDENCRVDVADADGKLPLHHACANQHVSIVETLIRKGASVDAVDSDGKSPLHYACSNLYEIVKLLIDNGANVDAVDANGKLPVHYAAERSFDMVELLYKHGARVDVVDVTGNLPIHYALKHNKRPIVELLAVDNTTVNVADARGKTLAHYICESVYSSELIGLINANLGAVDASGKLPLHYACMNESKYCLDIVQQLLVRDCETNVADVDGKLPLHYACANKSHNSPLIIELLLENGTSVNIVDASGKLPIHYACLNNYNVVQLLIAKEARIDITDHDGKLPVHHACLNETESCSKIVQLLISCAGVQDSTGKLPVHYVCVNKSRHAIPALELLLESGSTVDTADSNGKLPLHYACMNESRSSFEIVQLLINNCAQIDVLDSGGKLPISYAVTNESESSCKIVQLLINNGASVADPTLMHFACMNKSATCVELAQLLISKGCTIHAVNATGKLPLHYACSNESSHSYKIVQLLINNGSKVDVVDSTGKLPIHYACVNNCESSHRMVKLLTERGARVDVVASDGKLPMHYACMNGSHYATEIVKVLLECGSDVDAVDAQGRLPLHYASLNESLYSYQIVQLLIGKGAKIDVLDSDGKLPMDYASLNKSKYSSKIVQLLKHFG